MNRRFIVKSLVAVLSVAMIHGTQGKQKNLKIIIPNKIRYVHHHHTHVLVMKDKKSPLKLPDAKVHHLHLYQDGQGKTKEQVKHQHHYYIPYIPPHPQVEEDDAEDETVTKYSVSPPKGRYPPGEFLPHPHPAPVYEESPYKAFPPRFRFYDRSSDQSISSSENVMEYYEAVPSFPATSASGVQRHHTGKPSGSALSEIPEYPVYVPARFEAGRDSFYRTPQVIYPDGRFYGAAKEPPHLFLHSRGIS